MQMPFNFIMFTFIEMIDYYSIVYLPISFNYKHELVNWEAISFN